MPDQPDLTQDLAAGAPKPSPDRVVRLIGNVFSTFACVIAGILLVLVAAVELFITPRFIEIFIDFDTEMPGLTILLIDGRQAIAGACGFLLLLLVIKELVIRNPPVKLLINAVVILLAFGITIVTIFGLFLPLVTLMQSVQ